MLLQGTANFGCSCDDEYKSRVNYEIIKTIAQTSKVYESGEQGKTWVSGFLIFDTIALQDVKLFTLNQRPLLCPGFGLGGIIPFNLEKLEQDAGFTWTCPGNCL